MSLPPALERIRNGFSRRRFVQGTTAGVAALAATSALSGCSGSTTSSLSGEPQVVDDDSMIYIGDEYEYVDNDMAASYTWTLPLGTLLYYSQGSWAAAMMAPESAQSVNTLGVVSVKEGTLNTLVSTPENGSRWGFYDVRCGSGVFAWVEENFNTSDWVLLAQPFYGGALSGSVVELDSGDADWEPAKLAVRGKSVVWYKMPLASGSMSSQHSHCYLWEVGDSEATDLYESPGRFAANPRISDNILTIAPRVNADEGTYYGITALDLDDGGALVDQLVMPSTVKPFEATYMDECFAFSVEANYGYGGSLGNMGYYIGREGGPFVALSREPLACATGKGSRYFVKVQSSHFVIDTDALTYTVLTAPNDTLDYGDYPASEGETDLLVTYATLRGDDGPPESVSMRVFEL